MEYLLVFIFKIGGYDTIVVQERFTTKQECFMVGEKLVKDTSKNVNGYVVSNTCFNVNKGEKND